MATKKLLTPWMYQNHLFKNPDNKFGFVYLVTCTHPEYQKKYIGRKFFYTNFGKKTKQKESDWATYKTSSKYVKEAIQKYGLEYFTFEIIQLFDTRAGVVSAEVELQWAARVLHAVDNIGERIYINQAIGNIKFIAKEQLSEEQKIKMSNAQRGPLNHKFGKETSPEVKQKLSEAMKGRSFSEETRALISKAKLGKSNPHTGKSNFKSPIVGTNLKTKETIVLSGSDEITAAGFIHSCVYLCCNGKRKKHKGFTFKRQTNE